MCKCNSPIKKLIDAKNLKVSVRFIHTFTLRKEKGSQKTSYWSTFRRNYELKIISRSDMKKERSDLRYAISNLHQSCPWAAMGSPSWHSSHICGWEFQLTLTAAALQGLSLGRWVMCLPYVSPHDQMWLFREEIPLWQSKAVWNTDFVWTSPTLEVKE